MPDFFEAGSAHLGVINLHMGSGEDIIGDVTEIYGDESKTVVVAYSVANPVIPNLGHTQGEDGNVKMRIGILPLRPFVDTTSAPVEINRFHVAWTAPANEQMTALYNQMFNRVQVVGADVLNSLPKEPNIIVTR